jgi:cystathionine gamma-synthase
MTTKTDCVRGAADSVGGTRSIAPELIPGCTYSFDSQEQIERYFELGEGYLYSRNENPTVEQAAREIAQLEKAEEAAMFSSGMAAISTAVIALGGEKRRVVTQSDVYGGTAELMAKWLPTWGFEVISLTRDELSELTAERLSGAGLLYLETPTNPTLRLIDLEQVCAVARSAGVTTMVDSTFASPIVQQPLSLGVDLVMHSTTKYLGGHSDLLGGVVAGDKARIETIRAHRRVLGGVMDAFSAYLLMRGLRTLAVRLEAQQRSALRIAEALNAHPGVVEVVYPGLADHPEHDLAKRQMKGFGGMVSFRVSGGGERAIEVHDRLQLFHRAGSLGSVESLVSIPARMSHRHLSPEALRAAGIGEELIRLSIGLEEGDELIADLTQALA